MDLPTDAFTCIRCHSRYNIAPPPLYFSLPFPRLLPRLISTRDLPHYAINTYHLAAFATRKPMPSIPSAKAISPSPNCYSAGRQPAV